MFQTSQDQNYRSVLGLKRHPFAPEPDAKFYYPFDSFEQRLQLLNHLVQGTDLLVLVIGESGSGKTTLLHRYLVKSNEKWKADRINPYSAGESDQASEEDQLAGFPVFIQQDTKDPIVIVDDAHKLPERDLRFLLHEALVPESKNKIKRMVLFGEPASVENVPSSGAPRLALLLCCLGVLVLGIIPGLVMRLAEFASKMFAF